MFIHQLLSFIQQQVDHYTFERYRDLIAVMMPTLTILLVLYFVGLGWMMFRAHMALTPVDLAWHAVKVSLIFIAMTHWDSIGQSISRVLIHAPDRFIRALFTNTYPAIDTLTITQSIAHIWQTGCNVFIGLWKASSPELSFGLFMGLLGIVCVTTITAIPLFYILMGQLVLAVLLTIAPLWIPLLLWESTQSLFVAWLRLLIQWALTPFFVYIFFGLYLNLIEKQVSAMVINKPNTANIVEFLLLTVLVAATCVYGVSMARQLISKLDFRFLLNHGPGVPQRALKSWRETN